MEPMTRAEIPMPYMPGQHPTLKPGDRVMYVGEPRRFHPGQQECSHGDMGIIVHDWGWDSRFLIKMDRQFWGGDYTIRGGVADGVQFTIRSGASGWEKIHTTAEREG